MISNYINILATRQSSFLDFFRSILLSISSGIYSLTGSVFELFFKITDFTAFDGDLMQGLFNRLFMIIGVFMLFKLCVSFITYLINPEATKDKERGIGKLFGRLITMLLLLYLLIPQENFNAFEDQDTNNIYKSNGLLFGLLYDMQHRLIKQNTIPKLILGKTNSENFTKNPNDYNIGEIISSTVHGAFFNSSGECDDETTDVIDAAEKDGDFTNVVNYQCSGDAGGSYYAFEYNGFVAILVGLGLLVIVFLFCFDVAVRMLKLGILRLISPIPAISYIDPKSSKDGMFANYVKTVTSTYLDLFLRLAIIFLVISLIANITDNKLFDDPNSSGIAKVIVYISLLFFAGQAPKFIQQALGIKSKGTGLGFGASLIGGALSGMITGAATGGAWGALTGMATGAKAGSQNQWAAQNGQKPNSSATQSARDRVAQNNTGNYNAKGRSLSAMVGSRIGNRFMGMDRTDVDSAKGNMYYLEGKTRSAQNDFTNNIDGVVDLPGTSKWKNLATQDRNAVLAATEKVEKAKQDLEEMKMSASAGHAVPSSVFNDAQDALSLAETELTQAQQQQQTDYADYNNFINSEYGKAKKHFEIGDERLKRTDEQHVYRSRPHFKGSTLKNRYNYNGGNGGRYDKFDNHHPHT